MNEPSQPTAVEVKAKFCELISELEQQRKSQIFVIVHVGRHHICGPTMWAVINSRERCKGDTLELLIHSGGGHAPIAYKVMKFFRKRFPKVNVIVPLLAKSAATLMCLGADEIWLGEFAELGPLDVQIDDPLKKGDQPISPIDDFKSMEFLREHAVETLDYFIFQLIERSGMSIKEAIHESVPCVTGLVRPLYEKIDPLEVGGHRRSLAVGEEYAKRLLALVKNPNGERIAEQLVWKYPSHDFILDNDEALDLGLPVKHLDRATDITLVRALKELINYGIPFYGFVPERHSPNKNEKEPKAAQRKNLSRRANGADAVT
ncbi:MAG: SDH family Clp fold serine proteinase [Bryobacteraceae bacterium]